MSQATSTLNKFVGLTTLGLLTGSSLTLSLITAPTLLSLPSTQPAAQSLSTLSRASASLHKILSRTSLVALFAAWTLSPRGARHPYLLWTALPVLSLTGWEIYSSSSVPSRTSANVSNARPSARSDKARSWGSGSEDEDGWRDIEDAEAGTAADINGESVRDGLVEFRKQMSIRSAVWGLSFLTISVGIWGDGF